MIFILSFMVRFEMRRRKFISLESDALSNGIFSRKIVSFVIMFSFFISELSICKFPILLVSFRNVKWDSCFRLKLAKTFTKFLFFVFVWLSKLKNLLLNVKHFIFLKFLRCSLVLIKVQSHLFHFRIFILVHRLSNESHRWRRLCYCFLLLNLFFIAILPWT